MNVRRAWPAGIAVVIAAVLLAPTVLTDGALRDGATAAVWIAVAVALGFAVVVGGIPSLAQGAFVGVGAYAAALVRTRWGLDPLTAVVVVAVPGVVPAVLVGLACARLRSAFAAVTTWLLAWSFVIALEEFPGLTGGPRGIVLPAPQLDVASLGHSFVLGPPFWWFTALGFAALTLSLLAVARHRYGASFTLVRADAPAAAAAGLSVARLRTGALAASGWVAIVAGALLVQIDGIADPTRFGLDRSYLLLLAVLVGGATPFVGPILGLAVVEALSRFAGWALPAGASEYKQVLVAAALLMVIVVRPGGVVAWPSRLPRRYGGSDGRARDSSPPLSFAPRRGSQLDATGISVVIDADAVLDEVELSAQPGECLVVLGPNGSGKTMLARALAATVPMTSGTVAVGGVALDGTDARGRRRAGIARMLQRPLSAPQLTARDALFAAAEATRTTRVMQALTMTPLARAEQRQVAARVGAVLAWTDLTARADEPLDRLDATEQRLLQLGCTVVGDTTVVILDEPTAGLDTEGSGRLVDRIGWLRDRGLTVIVVEHDLEVVGQIADRWLLLCEGRVIVTGTGDTFRTDPTVRDAYLAAH